MEKSYFKAGVHLIETLTAGMYNDPLSIFREYIQNSVDSIDKARTLVKKKNMQVKIDIDPFSRKITIIDNGYGICQDEAPSVLGSIGSSTKFKSNYRGFRGIGRLGGLAFCENAIFCTKAAGEKVETVQTWDAAKLRQIINDVSSDQLSMEDVYRETTSIKQYKTGQQSHSYFKVTLEGVSSFRNYLFDLKRVESYLKQTIPIDFDDRFSYKTEISTFLHDMIPDYNHYNISLNGEKIVKPYTDLIPTVRETRDFLEGVKTFVIQHGNTRIAAGWYGLRHYGIGAIPKGQLMSGLRVRAGNILVGSPHLLDECFRENRFNGYIIGEIYTIDKFLIPNSRRDDFIDNAYKAAFFQEVEKTIGLPLSRDIRKKSRMNSVLSPTPEMDGKPKLDKVNGRRGRNLEGDIQRILRKTEMYPELTHMITEFVARIRSDYYR
jgi:hypothetical protein